MTQTEVYLVFEGGGARALAYIGAMRAIEDCGRAVKIKGIAGTSGGAIAAALFAAGYTSRDLFDWDRPVHDRGLLDFDLIDIFDRDKFRHWRDATGSWEELLSPWPRRQEKGQEHKKDWRMSEFAKRTAALWQSLPLIWKFPAALYNHGVFETDGFERWLEQMLRRKNSDQRAGAAPIAFSDLPYDLRVIATNLTKPGAAVFQQTEGHRAGTVQAGVARAVAASIAIPFVFRPVMVANAFGQFERFVDGGVTSNFPFWLFVRERSESDDISTPIIAIRTVDAAIDRFLPVLPPRNGEFRPYQRPGLAAHVRSLISAAVAGTENADFAPAGNLHVIDLPVNVSTLDFDIGADGRVALAMSGYSQMKAELSRNLALGPRMAIEAILDWALSEVRNAGRLRNDEALRINVMTPVSRNYLMVAFGQTMQGYSDAELLLPIDRGVAGEVFRTGKSANKSGSALNHDILPAQLRRLRPGLTFVHAVPIFSASASADTGVDVMGVLCCDSTADETAAFHDLTVIRVLEFAAKRIRETMVQTTATVGSEHPKL